jgi:hypothetical protein
MDPITSARNHRLPPHVDRRDDGHKHLFSCVGEFYEQHDNTLNGETVSIGPPKRPSNRFCGDTPKDSFLLTGIKASAANFRLEEHTQTSPHSNSEPSTQVF